MPDVQVFDLERLGLCIRFSVLEEVENDLYGLDGPATLGQLELFGLGSASNVAGEASEGNASLVVENIFKISSSLKKVLSLDGRGGFVGVLEVDAKIGSLG